MKEIDLIELKESNENGKNWFNAYQEIDSFLFSELERNNLDFPIIKGSDDPSKNTIEAIKMLIAKAK
ncbi:hypothetical protein [Winogradskyella helgolandensis]|uniref:hypothetical protein n=1 Tax=Winogradskyella helgolandensis TaxID=2697010 RepID=UPI0015BF8ABD|nr:hypothetical protein [Winogradskyella helgolandensis]